jgi:hypothetical protein
MPVYARCMTGLEDVWITRINQTLHLQDAPAAMNMTGTTPE